MSSPPPSDSPVEDLHQPTTSAGDVDGSHPASEGTFVELPGEPGQASLGPTADNDLDLLDRHLAEDGQV